MEIKKKTLDGKEVGVITLPDELFSLEKKVHPQTINDVVKSQLNNQRQGTNSTKTRSFVAGGGRKPWRQKGTGRSRQGSIRSPIWTGGGAAFGPLPRVYDQRPPKKMVDRALVGALSEMLKENRILVFDSISFESGKTKDVVLFLKNLKLEKVLFVVPFSSIYENFQSDLDESKIEKPFPKVFSKTFRATRNLKNVKMVTPRQVNLVDLLKYSNLAVSEKALKTLEEVLS